MKQPASRILSAWLSAAMLAAAISTGLAGCSAAAWTAAQFAPPKKISALYRLPKDRKVLVFVDDYLSEVGYEPIKGLLAEGVNERLAKEELVASTVPYRNLADLATARGTFNELAVSQVGQELGAEVVLYVHIDAFSTKDLPDSPLWHGQFRATVRVVDVKTGRLWPTDRPEGHAVEPVEIPSSDNPAANYEAQLTEEMASAMAERIVNLFRDHYVPATEAEKAE
jgi:hypothetical protein